jgi:MFS family permease
MRSSLLALNSDEAITGLQGLEVLGGRLRTVVAGNEYGSTTESYLVAPLLTFWTGAAPLRLMALLLSAGAAYALFRLARPFYGPVIAGVLALIGWTTSGAMVLLWSRAYLGYTTGFIAQVVAVALACHAMRSSKRLARTALLAGLAAGFAIWSHPMFGVIALLALITPTGYRWREWRRWWLPLVAGGLVGISPWLLFIADHGWPTPALATVRTTYSERLGNFLTELLPRAFGLRAPDGSWLSPRDLAVVAAAVLVIAALCGLVLLALRKGPSALPITVAGLLAFPLLAMFSQLGFVADARYSLPFLPQLLMGLGAWSLFLPERIRRSPWLVVTVPTIWALLLCVPVLHQQIGWQLQDPDRDAWIAVSELESRHIEYLAGDYWGTYLAGYFADGALAVRPDVSIRLSDQAAQVQAADPATVAYIYSHGIDIYSSGVNPSLPLPRDRYELLTTGTFDLYLPVASSPDRL